MFCAMKFVKRLLRCARMRFKRRAEIVMVRQVQVSVLPYLQQICS